MSNLIPGLDILGKGYDVFGRFAHPSGVYNARIFQDYPTTEETVDPETSIVTETSITYSAEVNGHNYNVPPIVSIVEEHTSEAAYIQGSSISSFQSELDVKVGIKGKYKFYSGEANFGFHQAKQSSQELYYTSFSALSRAYRLALPANSQLRPLLDEDFKAALESDDNSETAIDGFFNRYGTHFLTEVVMGGCNNYYATVEKSAVSSEMQVEASVKASYNSLFASGSVSVDTSYTSSESLKATHSETGVETVGGDENKAPLMLTDEEAYAEWLETIADDPALVDFTSQSLRPIWELCDPANTSRINALENRFNELSGVSNSTNTQGTLKHGAAVYPPWGEKSDWNLFISPSTIGRSEGSNEADANNAIMEFDFGIDEDYDYPDHWQIKAKYRYRMAHAKEDGTYKKKWYYDGWVNYILVPKYTYIYLPLTDLEYDRYDESTGIFYLDDVRVYTYNGGDHNIYDEAETANTLYENVYYQYGAFYQRQKVSSLHRNQDNKDELNSPDDVENWNSLFTPVKLSYTEDADDKEMDNALIRWDWTNNIYVGPVDIYDPTVSTTFASNCKYRYGSKSDYVITEGMNYDVLWVHKDFSFWTGAYGNQPLILPEADQKADDWELAVTPIRMGNFDESGDDELKDSALLQTQCTITRSDTNWTIDASFLWCGKEDDPDSVAWEAGQVECLFIRASILAETTLA